MTAWPSGSEPLIVNVTDPTDNELSHQTGIVTDTTNKPLDIIENNTVKEVYDI